MKTAPLLVLAALSLTSACRSPQPRFYTLVKPLASVASGSSGAAAPYELEVLPVEVPPQVDLPQIVLRETSGRVSAVDSRRRIAPLSAEIAGAISGELQRELTARDIHGLSPTRGLPIYRISVKVQRFESILDGSASINAVWSVRRAGPGDIGVLCHTHVVERAASGYSALAEAHQRALAAIARQIAIAIRGLHAHGGASTCAAMR